MSEDLRIIARKPQRTRRNVAGLDGPAPGPVVITLERNPPPDRIVEVVLIAAGEDGERPL